MTKTSQYTTIDYLPDLTASDMSRAGTLSFKPYTGSGTSGWDFEAGVYGVNSYALLHDTYKFTAKEGATYDVISTSYFDPFLLRIYDAQGNTIVANDESDDGSDFYLSGTYYSNDIIWNWTAPYTGTYYVAANWNQGSFYKFYALSLYEDVDTIPNKQTVFTGTALNDYFFSTYRDESFNGLAGTDTLQYSRAGSGYSWQKDTSGAGWVIRSASDGVDRVVDVERIKFSDKTIALDIDGIAGQAYRIYQAAFDRKPDNNGLKYWISKMDTGTGLESVANAFIGSQEFQSKYGENLSNGEFVSKIYNNVLHRNPDQSGYDYWLSQINSGSMTKANVLTGFAESAENKAALIGVIGNGIELLDI